MYMSMDRIININCFPPLFSGTIQVSNVERLQMLQDLARLQKSQIEEEEVVRLVAHS